MTSPLPHRYEMHTTDRDLAVAAVNQIVAHRPRISHDRAAATDFLIRSISYDGLGADQVRVGGTDYGSTTPPTSFLLAGVIAAGAGEISYQRRTVSLHHDDAFLWPTGVPYTCDFHAPAMAVVRLPLGYTAELAEELTGLPAGDLRFDAVRAVSAPMRRYWANTVAHVGRQLLNTEETLPELLTEQLQRLTAAVLIATFPNTTMTSARVPATGAATPAVVRRAIAYLDEHAGQRLTVGAVAAATGIGPRALQVAFRRHLDTTPMAYLRRVRLDRAHRDLQAADPLDVTVAAVARRWGFGDLGRFTKAYRTAYGQPPSRTLRT